MIQDAAAPLFPVSPLSVLVLCSAAVVLFIAAGAGMGGGPVLVPLYMVAGLSNTAAVALSNSTILAGSLGNVLCNARKRHPFKNKPLVDWDLVLLMEPPTLVGAIAGSYLNKLLPAWITASLLTLLLVLMTARIVQRASRIYARETAVQREEAAAAAATVAAGATQQQAGEQQQQQAAASPEQQRQQQPSAWQRWQQQRPASDTGADSAGLMLQPLHASPFSDAGAAATAASPGAAFWSPPRPASAAGAGLRLSRSMTPPPRSTTSSPFPTARGNLTGVPSSVLLNVQLEGDISEAALQRLTVFDHRRPGTSYSLDGLELSYASMLGVPHPGAPAAAAAGPMGQQQRVVAGELAAQEAPTEADRLAYAPPGHTRRNSWELAWEDEQQQQQQQQQHGVVSHVGSGGGGGGASMPTLLPPPPPAAAAAAAAACEVAASLQAAAVEAMLAAEAAQLPLLPIALLLAMFVAVLLTSLLSKLTKPCGSAASWAAQAAVVPVLGAIWWFVRWRLLAKVALKKAAQLDFHGEVRWTPRKSLVFPAVCSLAGLLAGLFGVGGAVVKTPLMLELGVHPTVTAATTQTMLLMTSAASSIVYAQMGDIPWDWASVMLPTAFCATLAGQAAIDALVRRVGRSSLVVLVLSGFFLCASSLSVYSLARAAQRVAHHPELLGRVGRICPAS